MELENILNILLKGWLKILFLVLQPGVRLMTHFTIMFICWQYGIHVCSIQGASNRIREDYEKKYMLTLTDYRKKLYLVWKSL